MSCVKDCKSNQKKNYRGETLLGSKGMNISELYIFCNIAILKN